MSPYLKGGGDSARRANRIRYFATRPGVEVLSDGGSQPATKKQKAYIQRLLQAFPDARELLEYEDYLKNQTQESASEFIRQAREDFAVPMSQRENYLDYVSHRPGVELRGEHGLWTSGGKVENLAEAVREVAEHPGQRLDASGGDPPAGRGAAGLRQRGELARPGKRQPLRHRQRLQDPSGSPAVVRRLP